MRHIALDLDVIAAGFITSPEKPEKAFADSFLPLGRRSKVQSSQLVWNRDGMMNGFKLEYV
jgi:hypothetical protein